MPNWRQMARLGLLMTSRDHDRSTSWPQCA